ncbi:molybdenum cofactor biosynthesis protein MoaE [Coralliovum pocilloporae]|uniref:molybdenum cofactor biosynthesis protein MoaE n=1 Tax=Coralliovum pocilloporae TaxID=3066369 RepID=UPI003307A8B4
MSDDCPIKIAVQTEAFDCVAESNALRAGRTNIGAIVSFTGICRDEEGSLNALELEHYPGMAEAEIQRVAEQAAERWPLQGITVIHRYGKLDPCSDIVLVLTASRHRRAAFQSAEFVMDFLKTRAPFWKKEYPKTGEPGGWVDAKEDDDEALLRWQD